MTMKYWNLKIYMINLIARKIVVISQAPKGHVLVVALQCNTLKAAA